METLDKENNTSLQNDFKPFAVADDANVIGQSEYERSDFLKGGFRKGLARSAEINKAIRQGSSVAAAVTGFIADKTGEAVRDNGDIGTLCDQFERAISSVSSLRVAEAQGTEDMLTASFVPTVKTLENGLLVHVRAQGRNGAATPTFEANGTGAKTVVKGNNLPLVVGDIAGAGHWLELQYDEKLDKWVLGNPARGVTTPSGVPVGTVEYFAMATPPAGYLKADGAVVSRTTYPDLFAAIGTTFGEGDGSATFNLPNLMGRFAEGGATPGTVREAGLPDIGGWFYGGLSSYTHYGSGAFYQYPHTTVITDQIGGVGNATINPFGFSASRSNSIYGNSNTVQPPALTLLPCIKAFDAVTDPGIIETAGLVQELSGKLDKTVGDKPVRYIADAYNDGSNWWRQWSDGWLEQGGEASIPKTGGVTVNLLIPYANENYGIQTFNQSSTVKQPAGLYELRKVTSFGIDYQDGTQTGAVIWMTYGMGTKS